MTPFLWRAAVYLSYLGGRLRRPRRHFPRNCNVCGYEGYFNYGNRGRIIDAKCPRCRASQRQRLFKLWLDTQGGGIAQADVLHFAHERGLAAVVAPRARTYTSADILPGRAQLQLDIENLALGDASYDWVLCLHVLEHVDDRRALREIHRVLKPGGLALIMVPVIEGWTQTYENPALRTPGDKLLHYGQRDHLRLYGADIRTRIRDAGFELDEFSADGADTVKYGLDPGERLFIGKRVA